MSQDYKREFERLDKAVSRLNDAVDEYDRIVTRNSYITRLVAIFFAGFVAGLIVGIIYVFIYYVAWSSI